MIKKETRKNITDHFDMEEIHFSGRMNDVDFLERLYDLKTLPSHDSRYENAKGDIWQHAVNNNDYEGNWVFYDDRFELLNGPHETFLKFICDMAHPLVRPDIIEANKILVIANDWLREDGWELYILREIAGGKILSYRQINAIQKTKESEVAHIWAPDTLRLFISHRDAHKVDVKKLSDELSKFGISGFVAHEDVAEHSSWRQEIVKALHTMDACLCYLTDDFFDSPWTNQEIGFALAKGLHIYSYRAGKVPPLGFISETQAIRTGIAGLITCLKKDFSKNKKFKNQFIKNFIEARDGSFSWAKDKFYDLVDLDFNDLEIESIVSAFSTKAKTSINQLNAILYDQIKDEHKKHPRLQGYTHYREYLHNDILKRHTSNRYTVQVITDERGLARVDILEKETL